MSYDPRRLSGGGFGRIAARLGLDAALLTGVLATGVPAAGAAAGTAAAAPDQEPRVDVSTERTSAHAGIPRPKVTDVAHRGASAYAPENTLAAIDAAAQRGASMVEFDVQRSSDGALVLLHDVTLARTTDVEEVFPDRAAAPVAEFTLEELRRLDAGSWFDDAYAGEPIPTLPEALDRIRSRDLGLLLEIKDPERHEGIEADISGVFRREPWWLVPARANRPHRLVIQSFDWEALERSHRLLPWIPHGLIGRVDEGEIAGYAKWADQINPNYQTIDAAYVDLVRDAGMEVFVYTVNDPGDMPGQIAKGVDGIISDYPDVLVKAITDSRI